MDNQSTNPKQALLERLNQSTNILVTVSTNPSVDQLAACLGLTLWLNKIGKHATAVFSGEVPSTLEFLQPEATLEKNTDSLRDFIISLDKSKADKLRYKVEDKVVKVFVTPYRTSLTADDLEFSQGDFNVDMVIALGVAAQQDLDTAITAHGRILHDAAVASITTATNSELGSINWHDSQASSLSELVADLGNGLDRTQLDGQIATALLTGVVAETDRFSNEKTTPQTMSVSAELMSAGANQQLVASKLDTPSISTEAPESVNSAANDTDSPNDAEPKSNDGTIEIAHDDGQDSADIESDAESASDQDQKQEQPVESTPEPEAEPQEPAEQPVDNANTASDSEPQATERYSRMITEPPTLGGTLTANSRPDDIMSEPLSDPLTLASTAAPSPLLDRQASQQSTGDTPLQPAPSDWSPPQPPEAPASEPQVADDDTLTEIERAVGSPHVAEPSLDSARDEVMRAINAVPDNNPEPIQALNAQPIDLTQPPVAPSEQPLQPEPSTSFDPNAFNVSNNNDQFTPTPELTEPVQQSYTMPLPVAVPPSPDPTSNVNDPTAPPPVPPPLMPPGFPGS